MDLVAGFRAWHGRVHVRATSESEWRERNRSPISMERRACHAGGAGFGLG